MILQDNQQKETHKQNMSYLIKLIDTWYAVDVRQLK